MWRRLLIAATNLRIKRSRPCSHREAYSKFHARRLQIYEISHIKILLPFRLHRLRKYLLRGVRVAELTVFAHAYMD